MSFGWVYIMRSTPDGPLKIGMTGCVRVRRKELRCPEGKKVKLVRAFRSNKCGAAEFRAHQILKSKAIGKEWFNATADEAITAVKQGIIDADNGFNINDWWPSGGIEFAKAKWKPKKEKGNA